ncbi:MAG: 2-C-methyl-D-erythritol 4-phosphate cytidylyltransferase [Candidatus Omnitrophota bacterium]
MKRTTALILAGGTGERMMSSVPKQFLLLAGKPIVTYSIETFESSEKISDILVVCHAKYVGEMEAIVSKMGSKKTRKVIPGGKTRQESSFLGVQNCPPGTEHILIHDAVRPFVSAEDIAGLTEAVQETGAAGLVIDLIDTVVEIDAGLIGNIPSRDRLKRIQTPQCFRCDVITKAHDTARDNNLENAADDCTLVLASGGRVKVVNGSEKNLKITSPLDIELAENIISRSRSF